MSARRDRDETGTVSAEAAVVLPLLALVAIGLAWLVALASTQARVVDAAREGARALARGDSEAAARGVTARVAPAGAAVLVAQGTDEARVEVRARVNGPGGVLTRLGLPAVTLHADAVAAVEPTGAGGPP